MSVWVIVSENGLVRSIFGWFASKTACQQKCIELSKKFGYSVFKPSELQEEG